MPQGLLLRRQVVAGRLRRQRFDAPHARRDRRLLHDLNQSDIARCPDVRAAAQFDGERLASFVMLARQAHGDHAHLIAVLFAEERHGAGCDGLIDRHEPGHDRLVFEDDSIGEVFNGGKLFSR